MAAMTSHAHALYHAHFCDNADMHLMGEAPLFVKTISRFSTILSLYIYIYIIHIYNHTTERITPVWV